MATTSNVSKSQVGVVAQRYIDDGATRVTVTKVSDDNYTVSAS